MLINNEKKPFLKTITLVMHFMQIYVKQREIFFISLISFLLGIFLLLDLVSIYLLGVILSQFTSPSPESTNLSLLPSWVISLDKTTIIFFAICMFFVKTCGQLVLSRKLFLRLSGLQTDIASQLLKRYLSSDYLIIKKLDAQRLLYFVNEGLHMITAGLIGSVLLLSFELLSVVFIIILLSAINLDVTILVLLMMIFFFASTTRILSRKMRQIGNYQVETGLESRRRMTDAIFGWKEIKSFQFEDYFSRSFITERAKLGKFLAIGTWYQGLSKYIFELFLLLAICAVAFFYQTDLFHKNISSSYLSLLLIAIVRMVPSFVRIQSLTIEFSRMITPSHTLLVDTIDLWSRTPKNNVSSDGKLG